MLKPGISVHRGPVFAYGKDMPAKIKIIVERYEGGYVAHPLGLRDGVSIVGEGDTYDEALADVTSAIRFAMESAAQKELFSDEGPVLAAFVAEAEVTLSAPVSRLRAEGRGHPGP